MCWRFSIELSKINIFACRVEEDYENWRCGKIFFKGLMIFLMGLPKLNVLTEKLLHFVVNNNKNVSYGI